MKNYFLAFRNIFNFKGESTINEFWSFFIINIIVSVVISILLKKLSLHEYVYSGYRLITVITLISLGFRRLKNAGYSGWLFLIPVANLVLASLPEKSKEK